MIGVALDRAEAEAARLIQWICILAACVWIGLALAGGLPGGEIALAAGLGVALFPLLVVARVEWLVLGVFISVYTLDGLSVYGLVPRSVTWMTEIFVFALLVRVAIHAVRIHSIRIPAVAGGVVLAMIASTIVGATYGLGPVQALLGVRKYLTFPTLGLCVAAYPWGHDIERRLGVLILVVAVAQIPITFVQFLTVGGGDPAGGSLGPGGTGLIGLINVSVALAIIATLPRTLGRTGTLFRVITALLLLVPPMLGSALIVLPLGLAGLAVVLILRATEWQRVLPAVLALGMVGWMALPLATAIAELLRYPDPMELFSRWDIALNYGRIGQSSMTPGRIDQILLGWRISAGDGLASVVFGHGPYAASRSYFGQTVSGRLSAILPSEAYFSSSVARGLVEIGLTGVLAWVAVLVDGVRRGWVIARNDAPSRQFIGALAVFSGLVLLVGGLYNDCWNEPPTALLWWATYGIVVRLTTRPGTSSGSAEVVIVGDESMSTQERSAGGSRR